MDQTRAPYFEAWRAYVAVDRAAFHTPGHIHGRGAHPLLVEAIGPAALALDLSPGLGGMDTGEGSPLEQAQILAARAYGADQSWFLVNGSTAGNQIMVSSVCSPGDAILTSRNTHKSIVSALILAGVRPVHVANELDPHSHVAHGVTPDRIAAGLDAHPEAKAVLIVSPTYYGVCSDVAGIAEVAHERGVPLLVDEAWGPHFPFHPSLPSHAMAQGADLAVTGVHKLLGALSQASILHARGDLVDRERVGTVSNMVQSTSPSCLLRASLDVARMQMATAGRELLGRALALAATAREAIDAHPRLEVLGHGLIGTLGVVDFDPTRLVVNVAGTGYSGYEVDHRLFEEHGVTVELSDFANVLANITIGHDQADIDRLVRGLLAVADDARPQPLNPRGFVERALTEMPEQVLNPGEAFHADQERVPLEKAVSRVSAEMAATYPPGIPLVIPGERLSDALVAYLAAQVAAGGRIVGPHDPLLRTIQVVRE